MKTGRVRKREERPAEEPEVKPPVAEEPARPPAPEPEPRPAARPSPQPSPRPTTAAAKRRKSSNLLLIVFIAIVVIIACIVIMMLLRGGTDEWVEATRANGAWTATTTVFGPQVLIQEKWEADCISDPSGSVRVGSCILKDANTYRDTVIEDYEEYAYDIYYEETYQDVYNAQGTEFAVTALGTDDWWEENLHYAREEELDRDSCQYTSFTLWVNDPNDSTQEVEVFLSECEVWDHVTVTERVYDQKDWCQCNVTTLAQIGTQTEQGTGTTVHWPQPAVPAGGNTQQAFSGKVTFLGNDYSYTVTTDDPNQYQDYMTGQYYIGLRNEKPVTVSKNPSD